MGVIILAEQNFYGMFAASYLNMTSKEFGIEMSMRRIEWADAIVI